MACTKISNRSQANVLLQVVSLPKNEFQVKTKCKSNKLRKGRLWKRHKFCSLGNIRWKSVRLKTKNCNWSRKWNRIQMQIFWVSSNVKQRNSELALLKLKMTSNNASNRLPAVKKQTTVSKWNQFAHLKVTWIVSEACTSIKTQTLWSVHRKTVQLKFGTCSVFQKTIPNPISQFEVILDP